jgi:hypothetical protein
MKARHFKAVRNKYKEGATFYPSHPWRLLRYLLKQLRRDLSSLVGGGLP